MNSDEREARELLQRWQRLDAGERAAAAAAAWSGPGPVPVELAAPAAAALAAVRTLLLTPRPPVELPAWPADVPPVERDPVADAGYWTPQTSLSGWATATPEGRASDLGAWHRELNARLFPQRIEPTWTGCSASAGPARVRLLLDGDGNVCGSELLPGQGNGATLLARRAMTRHGYWHPRLLIDVPTVELPAYVKVVSHVEQQLDDERLRPIGRLTGRTRQTVATADGWRGIDDESQLDGYRPVELDDRARDGWQRREDHADRARVVRLIERAMASSTDPDVLDGCRRALADVLDEGRPVRARQLDPVERERQLAAARARELQRRWLDAADRSGSGPVVTASSELDHDAAIETAVRWLLDDRDPVDMSAPVPPARKAQRQPDHGMREQLDDRTQLVWRHRADGTVTLQLPPRTSADGADVLPIERGKRGAIKRPTVATPPVKRPTDPTRRNARRELDAATAAQLDALLDAGWPDAPWTRREATDRAMAQLGRRPARRREQQQRAAAIELAQQLDATGDTAGAALVAATVVPLASGRAQQLAATVWQQLPPAVRTAIAATVHASSSELPDVLDAARRQHGRSGTLAMATHGASGTGVSTGAD